MWWNGNERPPTPPFCYAVPCRVRAERTSSGISLSTSNVPLIARRGSSPANLASTRGITVASNPSASTPAGYALTNSRTPSPHVLPASTATRRGRRPAALVSRAARGQRERTSRAGSYEGGVGQDWEEHPWRIPPPTPPSKSAPGAVLGRGTATGEGRTTGGRAASGLADASGLFRPLPAPSSGIRRRCRRRLRPGSAAHATCRGRFPVPPSGVSSSALWTR
mmetsp:Transcript_26457/g.78269  ORF Transcript_26457/g.78269 Transcript_26457/m.78269 type:complete len:222 (-) Transcript_26457:122-787(-)